MYVYIFSVVNKTNIIAVFYKKMPFHKAVFFIIKTANYINSNNIK